MAAKGEEYFTNAIRGLAIDMVQTANSGHPGAPMGMAPVANLLFSEFLKFDGAAPQWHNRDRFVLSNGHASALVYSMLHLSGFDLPLAELKRFRQLGSATPGHPERGVTSGVEVTTGPLGQGVANAVGIALAEAHLAATFNRPGFAVVDHFTIAFCGDGCLMEGVAQEALSLAGHLALEKLIIIYDDNHITIDGPTTHAYTEQKEAKYKALNFRTIVVADGDADYAAMRAAIAEARTPCGKPTMILLRTTIGHGAKLQGTSKVHGAPLGWEEIDRLKTEVFGRDNTDRFAVEPDVYEHFQPQSGKAARAEWEAMLEKYKAAFPAEAAMYEQFFGGVAALPAGWQEKLPRNDDKTIATRKASENALAVMMPLMPQIVGGSADLTGSNLTRPGEAALVDFQRATPEGRYIRFGVREHGMAAILNGIDAHGGLIAFGGTFLNFIGYALGAVRMSCMSHHGVVFVATHDSIGLGEDGPTHQPVEVPVCLRALPNLLLFRPADQTETSACWAAAIEHRGSPSVLCLSRQGCRPLPGSSFDGVKRGAYATVTAADPDVILVGTGSEVQACVDAAALCGGLSVRVVSMPSTSLFEMQPTEYKAALLPDGVPVVSVEVYAGLGWERYSHFHVGLQSWGASAPADQLYEHFGITATGIAEKAKAIAAKYPKGTAPSKAALVL